MTVIRNLLLALILLFAAPLTASAATPHRAGASGWTSRVTVSPIGGHVLGNPAAPTKVVEYVSYTCPHCAHFVAEGTQPLTDLYVKTGKVSAEVRNAVRDKYDLTAALLARCGGPARFMGNHLALFANQDRWMGLVISYDQHAAQPSERLASLRDIGQNTGLYDLMQKRGFTPAQLDACINDPASMKAVLAMTDESRNKVHITGTPAFTVNGKLVDGATWDALKAALPPVAR
jgi:protein-disulfide isomerase